MKYTNWPTIIFLIIFHLGAIAALLFWSWPALISLVILYWLAGSVGIGLGYHRLLTHRSYKTSKTFEYFLAICGSLALEGGPLSWTTIHRIHHANTDKLYDPHSPRDGKWWSHIGWILTPPRQFHDPALYRRYAPDIVDDQFYKLLDRFYYVPLLILSAIILFIFGWEVLLWATFLRVTLGLHATWLVNSATHLWGNRRFSTSDDSKNNWWVALLTFGEGWHNSHHMYPTSARHGLKWYEIDFNWYEIYLLEKLRIVKSIKLTGDTK